ncbi:MAG: HpcH/HpaI aldolase/citrate lyase family protein [Pseudomonadota bacterium]
MTPNAFKRGMKAGEAQIGLWISLCSGFAADIVADIGYDWLLLDMEHAPNELPTVLQQLQSVRAYSSTALVRPMWNDFVLVKRLMDIGAPGLLFPMVQNAEEAAAAVAACRYPPKGIRGVSNTQRGNRYGRDPQYFEQVEEETCILVQVETKDALERVEEIAAVEGVDGVFFGPADIAASLGLMNKLTDDALWRVIFDAADKVKALGKPCGTLVGNAELTKRVLDEGFLFVAVGSDHSLLARGAEALLARSRG